MAFGYYRFPTIYQDKVVFVCEDDLWEVSAEGGLARRLTANEGPVSWPQLSPDGTQLAFVGREEGPAEVHLMPAQGGPSRRLTYLGDYQCRTLGWAANGRILFSSVTGQPFADLLHIHALDPESNQLERLNIGPARAISFGPDGGMVIGRNNRNPARWKRYRGGTAGQIWMDANGDNLFQPLLDLPGNLDSPLWLNGRIYFLSDHQGIGNLYSCLPTGEDVRRHTDHHDFYARNANSDGRSIVYHAGADLYLFDPASDTTRPIAVALHSPQTQRNRKFVSAEYYLDSCEIHPQGHSVAITTRGKPFTFANWEGAVRQHGQPEGVRYRLLTWLNDGKRLLAVSDEEGEERFVIFPGEGRADDAPQLLPQLDIGRPLALAVNPQKDEIIFSNHRYELLHLNLENHQLTLIDRGHSARISGFDWSPDGTWVAYSLSISTQRSGLRLWDAETGQTHPLTQPVLYDFAPSFDPDGKYVYFLSFRHFNPVHDQAHFSLNFPRGEQPYLVTLQKGEPSPFIPTPRAPGQRANQNKPAAKNNVAPAEPSEGEAAPANSRLQIDLEGITNRIIQFPVVEGSYSSVQALKEGRVLYLRYPIEGALERHWANDTPAASSTLYSYDLTEGKENLLVSGVSNYDLSRDKETLIYRSGNRLRVLKAGIKPDNGVGSQTGRESGWLGLSRVRVSVTPTLEWQQMYREAWRLQRDQFWTPDMSQIDWLAVYERYWPLLERVGSRAEFSDLMGEMQGELGTSHAYEWGGDYRDAPAYSQGKLAADLVFNPANGRWLFQHIVQGDAWDESHDSPLGKPGLNVAVGDYLLAVNGRFLSATYSPQQALVNLAGQEVTLTIAHGEEEPRTITVKALWAEMPVRYRQWVETNRRRVHEASNGRLGYIHIPDMQPHGYAEFYRAYLAEVERVGLIVDVRFNAGGNVSQLILEKLARRPIAYRPSRWDQIPHSYPSYAIPGPIVAITNEHAASDGDIFSHAFKLMGLGPLVGKRTWGGVIGISPRHVLVDRTLTTQPEFATWFPDVGWQVENYGTDPDIEVEMRPQDYAQGVDPQLDRAVAEALALLEANPPQLPTFDGRPSLALPRLPER